jgi:hypothetical protein
MATPSASSSNIQTQQSESTANKTRAYDRTTASGVEILHQEFQKKVKIPSFLRQRHESDDEELSSDEEDAANTEQATAKGEENPFPKMIVTSDERNQATASSARAGSMSNRQKANDANEPIFTDKEPEKNSQKGVPSFMRFKGSSVEVEDDDEPDIINNNNSQPQTNTVPVMEVPIEKMSRQQRRAAERAASKKADQIKRGTYVENKGAINQEFREKRESDGTTLLRILMEKDYMKYLPEDFTMKLQNYVENNIEMHEDYWIPSIERTLEIRYFNRPMPEKHSYAKLTNTLPPVKATPPQETEDDSSKPQETEKDSSNPQETEDDSSKPQETENDYSNPHEIKNDSSNPQDTKDNSSKEAEESSSTN